MGLSSKHSLFLSGLLAGASAAVLPRPAEEYIVRSLVDRDVSLSFKETTICETTSGVKGYSGYINIPANATEGRTWDTNTFFWFFESRKDPQNAPLSLWLQGGPGVASIQAVLGENGPCSIEHNSRDTTLNKWSWNNEVNMLYIDQPVQTGLSYDTIINGTIDETGKPYIVTPTENYENVNSTVIAGKFPSGDPKKTTPTTATAALSAWHFMQIWMKEFPHYSPKDNKISLWGESYAGHWVPGFADFFTKQNAVITANSDSAAIPIHLDTVGLVNPCIDITTQMPFYPEFAINNTYGIQRINETQYKAAVDAWPACKAKIEKCEKLGEEKDPQELGMNEEVNNACADAFKSCFATMHEAYNPNVNNVFDIASVYPSSFPPSYAAGYLADADIQSALGARVNFTGLAAGVESAFNSRGDFVRGHGLRTLGQLLDQGVKVALMYGDRDYQCNWLGGEALSLAIDSASHTAGFHAAGYTPLQTNNDNNDEEEGQGGVGKVGGMVRQHGNLTFARIFEAGHEVPWYQPETAYRMFQRVMFNKDVATGEVDLAKCKNKGYSTAGVASVFDITSEVPEPEVSECYFWNMFRTCTPAELKFAKTGMAVWEEYHMVGYTAENGTVVKF